VGEKGEKMWETKGREWGRDRIRRERLKGEDREGKGKGKRMRIEREKR
jgi:hypothetical protein